MKQQIDEGKPVPALMDPYYLDYFDPYRIFWGIGAIRTFAQDLRGWASMESEALMPRMRECSDFMRSVAYRLEGHSYFLESASEILKSVELKEVAVEVYKIAQSWSLLRSMFFKASKKEPLAMLRRIENRLQGVVDREEKALITLKQILETSP